MQIAPNRCQPRCSILVPAFDYPEGISRILDGFSSFDPMAFEIVISDDSRTDCVEQLVESHETTKKGLVKYHKNRPGLGAVDNWNHLISCAESDVLVLLHHDEFFIDPRGFYRAVNEVCSGRADVVVGQVRLLKKPGERAVIHFPLFLARLLINKFPEYLYVRNFIGPISCLVFRRSLSVRFDAKLRWLVDVDFYYRLRVGTNKWSFLKYYQVFSVTNRIDSITGEIRYQLCDIAEVERTYICENRSLKVLSRMYSSVLIKCAEASVWAAFRVIWNSIRFIIKSLPTSR
jgi:glycosyltransferase involved in cell wall biosynthesis